MKYLMCCRASLYIKQWSKWPNSVLQFQLQIALKLHLQKPCITNEITSAGVCVDTSEFSVYTKPTLTLREALLLASYHFIFNSSSGITCMTSQQQKRNLRSKIYIKIMQCSFVLFMESSFKRLSVIYLLQSQIRFEY